jgi:mitochondrial intermembrane space import and assembly protein 40
VLRAETASDALWNSVTISQLNEPFHDAQETRQPTLDAIIEEKRRRQLEEQAQDAKQEQHGERGESQGEGSIEDIEEEADQQGAFNPETGEINWDCPCLGGMAHGPCGEEFKAAFSCFVYSKEEPKGMECIDKFK